MKTITVNQINLLKLARGTLEHYSVDLRFAGEDEKDILAGEAARICDEITVLIHTTIQVLEEE